MRIKWQQGSLRKAGKRRKVWLVRYRVNEMQTDGTIVRRQVERVIGAVAEYPTRTVALARLREIIREADGAAPRPVVMFDEFLERWRENIMPHLSPTRNIPLRTSDTRFTVSGACPRLTAVTSD